MPGGDKGRETPTLICIYKLGIVISTSKVRYLVATGNNLLKDR